MAPDDFSVVQERLDALIDEAVTDLAPLCGDVRPDGIPQDWVDDLGALSQGQRDTLKQRLSEVSLPWCQSLHDLL